MVEYSHHVALRKRLHLTYKKQQAVGGVTRGLPEMFPKLFLTIPVPEVTNGHAPVLRIPWVSFSNSTKRLIEFAHEVHWYAFSARNYCHS